MHFIDKTYVGIKLIHIIFRSVVIEIWPLIVVRILDRLAWAVHLLWKPSKSIWKYYFTNLPVFFIKKKDRTQKYWVYIIKQDPCRPRKQWWSSKNNAIDFRAWRLGHTDFFINFVDFFVTIQHPAHVFTFQMHSFAFSYYGVQMTSKKVGKVNVEKSQG